MREQKSNLLRSRVSPFFWIMITTIAGGALSVLLAGAIALSARASWVPMLVSFAVGTLLGAVFLETLPHVFELSPDPKRATLAIMLGILFFFVLEKLVLWRHHHAHSDGAMRHSLTDGHDHGRSGAMILLGDTIHNFVDGVLIAAAFLADFQLGMVTAFAIIAHEIPQEVGDFLVLLHSGYSRARALAFNLLSSLASIVGGVLGFLALKAMEQWIPTLLALATASMLYVAVADLIPGLHRRPELAATAQQVILITLGIAAIVLGHELLERAV